MAVGDLSFAFDGKKDASPEGARKRRDIAQAMMGGGLQMPQNVGQGLAALGNAFQQRAERRASQFPDAPTSATPQPFNFGNFFARRFGINQGGLY